MVINIYNIYVYRFIVNTNIQIKIYNIIYIYKDSRSGPHSCAVPECLKSRTTLTTHKKRPPKKRRKKPEKSLAIQHGALSLSRPRRALEKIGMFFLTPTRWISVVIEYIFQVFIIDTCSTVCNYISFICSIRLIQLKFNNFQRLFVTSTR